MIRAYPLKHAINIGKQKKIATTVEAYRKLAVKLAALQWQEFYRHGKTDKNLDVKTVETPLSERYKQTCQYQVVGLLKSFIANRQKEFVRTVWRSKLDEKRKLELFYINKYELWFAGSANMPAHDEKGEKIKGKSEPIPEESIRLARAIFKHVMRRHRKPSLKRCNLALDNKVARISPREDSKKKSAKKFDYWIKFSTLESGYPIYLPLSTNKYFDDKEGTLNKFCQINYDEQERITVCLLKDVKKRTYVAKTPKIGLDFGLRNLFATDDGGLYGRDFIETLKKYDRHISSLASNRQRQKLAVKSRAYNSLVRQLRHFLKNEINRVINRIIAVYQPQELVVEKLNFTSPQLSRRMNRLLSNAGRKIIREKFDSISEEFGIVITTVPAPYTSQECSQCGYVDELNRKNQSTFLCRHCNKKLHADVNGARILFARSSDKKLSNVYLSREAILDILIAQFLRNYPDVYDCVPSLMESNRYFKQGRTYGTSGSSEYG